MDIKRHIDPKRKQPIHYDFQGVAPIDFYEVIWGREDSGLTRDAKKLVCQLYDDLADQAQTLGLRYTNVSFNLLICLKEAHKKLSRIARRDRTSAYIHEIAQATYFLWLHDNTAVISKWLKRRLDDETLLHPELRLKQGEIDNRLDNRLVMTTHELDIFIAIAFNHDSIEDLDLTEDRLRKALLQTPRATEDDVEIIVQTIVALSKLSDDPYGAWIPRVIKGGDIAILSKMIDRQHNLATMIGSDRSEDKVQDYLDDTLMFLEIAGSHIRQNGTLTYVGQYLYDQVDLIKLYYDVKSGIAPEKDLEECFKDLVKKYKRTSIDPEIHPMLCIAKRIVQDEQFRHLERNLLRPDTIHDWARWGQRTFGLGNSKRVA